MRSSVAFALFFIFSKTTEGGRCILSNTDLGVVQRDDSLGVVGVLGVSGSGRFKMLKPRFREPTRSCQEAFFMEGVGEGGMGNAAELTYLKNSKSNEF